MKKSLRNELINLDQTGFRELELAIEIARKARQIAFEFDITDEEFAKEMGIKTSDVVAYKTGAFKYTLRDIARLDAYATNLIKGNIKVDSSVVVADIGDDKSVK
jgi:translation elongation factor EF-Tu-like GTPase